MTFTEAAAQVLRLVGKPLHYKEITDVAIEKDLLSHVGKSPEVTMGARLAALAKKGDKDNPLVRVKPGVFALREWDKDTVEQGLNDRTPALERIAKKEAEQPAPETSSDDQEASNAPLAEHRDVDDDANPPDPEEKRRAEFAAEASEIFEAEEDDDEPIFAGDGVEEDRGEATTRRRRRRRRRSRSDSDAADSGDDLPSYTVSDVPEDVGLDAVESEPKSEKSPRGPRPRRERPHPHPHPQPVSAPIAPAKRLAETLEGLLGGYDKNRGSVSLQSLADAAKRTHDSNGEFQLTSALLGVAARADNARRELVGQRPRFRLSGNRISLEGWAVDSDLASAERELSESARKHRELAEKSLLRAFGGLPHRAVGEICVVLLEQLGLREITSVRRPGTHGAELHLKATAEVPGGEVRVGVVIRRDGREIGRERVTELRGALHHYGPAAQGYLVTTGQVLSGAREEARAAGAAPVMLIDGARLVELCFQYGLLTCSTPLRVQIPDYALLDSLR